LRGWPENVSLHLIREPDSGVGGSRRDVYTCVLAPSTISKEVDIPESAIQTSHRTATRRVRC
jgi:hypothetical protein